MDPSSPKALRRTNPSTITPLGPTWNQTYAAHHSPQSHYYLAHSPAGNVTVVMPPSPSGPHFEAWGNERPVNLVPRASLHWGHIVFFYLVEQMHRWRRFVFRFDKQFPSMGALKSITGRFLCNMLFPLFDRPLCIIPRRCAFTEGIRSFERRGRFLCRVAMAAKCLFFDHAGSPPESSYLDPAAHAV